MTENVKKLNELASADEALSKRLTGAQDKEAVATIAAEAGIELTDADFEAIEAQRKRVILAQGSEKLSDDELNAVAGGDQCYCVAGGGGVARSGDSIQYGNGKAQDKTCVCVAFGQGNYELVRTDLLGEEYSSGGRCSCIVAGEGATTVAGREGWL